VHIGWECEREATSFISASTKLNVHLCFCKNCFSRHQRAAGEAILSPSLRAEGEAIFQTDRLLRFAIANRSNDVDFFALALLVMHYQNVNIRLILWNYLILSYRQNKKSQAKCLGFSLNN
jgi:hypothetical protein